MIRLLNLTIKLIFREANNLIDKTLSQFSNGIRTRQKELCITVYCKKCYDVNFPNIMVCHHVFQYTVFQVEANIFSFRVFYSAEKLISDTETWLKQIAISKYLTNLKNLINGSLRLFLYFYKHEFLTKICGRSIVITWLDTDRPCLFFIPNLRRLEISVCF